MHHSFKSRLTQTGGLSVNVIM